MDTQDQTERFAHFVQLVHKTLSSGRLASLSPTTTLAVTEGKASVQSGDEIWILFGCAAPVVLRHAVSHFLVVSPAYIGDVMNGEVVHGVHAPDDDETGGWSRVLREGCLEPAPVVPYVSGRRNWLVQVIRLR